MKYITETKTVKLVDINIFQIICLRLIGFFLIKSSYIPEHVCHILPASAMYSISLTFIQHGKGVLNNQTNFIDRCNCRYV